MWDKDFRKLIFYLIYQSLFLDWEPTLWQNLKLEEKNDLIEKNKNIIISINLKTKTDLNPNFKETQVNSLSNLNKEIDLNESLENEEIPKLVPQIFLEDKDYLEVVDQILKDFFAKKDIYWKNIKKNLKDTKKTYMVVQACLYCYILEKEFIEKEILQRDSVKYLVGKYIKLSQNFIGDDNVSLVHAVLIKL